VSTLLNPFEPGAAAALALFATRVGGAMMIAPVFSARTVPVPVRVAVLVVLTAATAPFVLGRGATPSIGPVTLLSELLIGFGVGLGAALIIGASQIAGDVLAFQMGLSGASTLDPLSQQQTTALSDLFMLMVVALVLTMDGHILILEALADSVVAVPLGSGIEARAGMLALAGLGSNLFVTGVRIAAPVMAAVFIGNVAMGVLARTAPQLQLFMLAYPLQIVLGTAVLALTLPLISVSFTGWAGEYRGFVMELLDTFGGR
jgi:flagellar biosynthetic protein FliR